MAKDRVHMPSSTAGLTRYFEDYQSRIEMRPWTIVALCIGAAVLIILLHVVGSSFFT